MKFDNLHQILRSLYEQMMPLCGDMAGVAKGIAGLGALFYVAYRVWQSLARAEPIDVFPMLRPFAIGLCIMFFPTVVLGTINSILSPVVQGTAKMLEAETLDMNRYREQKDKLEYEAMVRNPETAYLVSNEEFDKQLEELGWSPSDMVTMAGMYIDRGMYNMKKSIRDFFREILELLFQAAALVIDTVRTFFLVVLAILGPIAFALSVWDGFQNTLTQWICLAMGIITANAQENVTVETTNGSEQPTLTKEVYPQKEADGDLYHGLSRKLTFDRMIPPHGLEVTYDKTVHVIFPAEVRYVDLGSPDLIAGKADGAENIIRVKATVRNFPNETNMSVITEDGSFYTFNVKYAAEPLLLNVEMCDFIHDGSTVNRPNNAQEIYLKELGSESPMLVRLIMKSIHKQNKREVKHIGCKRFGIQYLLKGIYTHNGLLYFHTEIKNQSNVPFDVDYITWKIVDKKVAKRTAVQEQIILPLRAQNYATLVPGKKSERTVFTMAKFTIPDDKCLVVELNEKNGGRHQSFVIENEDLVRAGTINELQVR